MGQSTIHSTCKQLLHNWTFAASRLRVDPPPRSKAARAVNLDLATALSTLTLGWSLL